MAIFVWKSKLEMSDLTLRICKLYKRGLTLLLCKQQGSYQPYQSWQISDFEDNICKLEHGLLPGCMPVYVNESAMVNIGVVGEIQTPKQKEMLLYLMLLITIDDSEDDTPVSCT